MGLRLLGAPSAKVGKLRGGSNNPQVMDEPTGVAHATPGE